MVERQNKSKYLGMSLDLQMPWNRMTTSQTQDPNQNLRLILYSHWKFEIENWKGEKLGFGNLGKLNWGLLDK